MLVGSFLISAGAAAYEIVPASINPVVMAELDVGPVAAGWLVSIMFLTAVLASVPIGVALARVDVDRAATVATAGFVATCAWGWYAAETGSYDSLVASRVLGGVTYIALWNIGNLVVGTAYGDDRRATAVGIFTASAPAGFALAQFTGPLVERALGWGAVFAVYGVVVAIGLALYLLAGGRPADATGSETAVPTGSELRAVLVDRRVWLISLLGFFAYTLYLFINSWLPTYMNETGGLSLAQSGVFVAFFPAMGMVSRMSGGVISDRLFGARRRPVAILSFVVTAPIFVGFALVSNVVVLFVLLAVAGYSVQLGLGLFFSYVREVVDPNVASTAISLLTSVGLFGAFAAPIGAGWLIERTGTYTVAFGLATAMGVVAAVLSWFAPRVAEA